MGTGVEVIGTGSDEIVAISSDDDWVFSDSWDRAVDERENMNVEEVISHINYSQLDKHKQMAVQRYHILINRSISSTLLHM